MPYSREVKKVHNTIKRAGKNAVLTVLEYPTPNPQTGETGEPITHVMYFCRTRYDAKDLRDPSIASGLTKVLVSPLNQTGGPIDRFTEVLTNKNAKVILPNKSGVPVSVSKAIITSPDAVNPIMGRLFLEG